MNGDVTPKKNKLNESESDDISGIHSDFLNSIQSEENLSIEEESSEQKSEITESFIEREEISTNNDEQLLSNWILLSLTLSLGASSVGICMCFSVKVMNTTPFLESCGFSQTFTSIFWVAGPLFTIFIDPFIGYLNDRIYIPYFGRRRPLLAFGGLFMAVFFSIFSNSKVLGNLFSPNDESKSIIISKIFAGVSFLFIDVSLRITMTAHKSLIVDLIPKKQQVFFNAIVNGFFLGVGNIMGFILGAVPWKKFVPLASENVQVLYWICNIILLFTITITCIFVREKNGTEERNEDIQFSINNEDDEEVESSESRSNSCKFLKIFCDVFSLIFKLPLNFWICYIIQLITFTTKYVVYVYISLFVAIAVFKGDPHATEGTKGKELFEEGIMWSNIGGILMALSAIIYGLLLTPLLKYFSVKFLWFVGQFCLGASVISGSLFTFSKYLELFPFFFFGIVVTSMNSIPWSIINVITRESEKFKKNKALIQTIFFTTAAFPQLFVALVGGPTLWFLDEIGLPNFIVLFLLAGILAWSSLIFVVVVKIPESMNEKNKLGLHSPFQLISWMKKKIL